MESLTLAVSSKINPRLNEETSSTSNKLDSSGSSDDDERSVETDETILTTSAVESGESTLNMEKGQKSAAETVETPAEETESVSTASSYALSEELASFAAAQFVKEDIAPDFSELTTSDDDDEEDDEEEDEPNDRYMYITVPPEAIGKRHNAGRNQKTQHFPFQESSTYGLSTSNGSMVPAPRIKRRKSSLRRPKLINARAVQSPSLRQRPHPYAMLLRLSQCPADTRKLKLTPETLDQLGIMASPEEVLEELQFFAHKCLRLRQAEERVRMVKSSKKFTSDKARKPKT